MENIVKLNPVMQMTESQKLKQDTLQFFQRYNQRRLLLNFKHFICVDLFTKEKINRRFLVTELLIYKFLLLLGKQIREESKNLLVEIEYALRETKKVSEQPEVRALLASFKREDQFYDGFYQDLIEGLEQKGLIHSLKSDTEAELGFRVYHSHQFEQDREKFEALLEKLSKEIFREILGEIKKKFTVNQNEEIFR